MLTVRNSQRQNRIVPLNRKNWLLRVVDTPQGPPQALVDSHSANLESSRRTMEVLNNSVRLGICSDFLGIADFTVFWNNSVQQSELQFMVFPKYLLQNDCALE